MLSQAKNWIKELRKMLGEDIVVCVVGNKIDLEKNRTVSKSEAERYVKMVPSQGAYLPGL